MFAIVLMYSSYLVFDATTYFVQHRTYVNQYMVQLELYKQIESQQEVKETVATLETPQVSEIQEEVYLRPCLSMQVRLQFQEQKLS